MAVRSLFSVNINENIHNNPSLWQWSRSWSPTAGSKRVAWYMHQTIWLMHSSRKWAKTFQSKLFTGTVIAHEFLFPKNPRGRTKYPVKIHQCSGARKTKTSDGAFDHAKVFVYLVPLPHLPSLSFTFTHPLCLVLAAINLFNSNYISFKDSVCYKTSFFFLVHCCVIELIPIISLICSKEKGRFLKTCLLRTSSWILRLKYESKYCLLCLIYDPSALLLVIILVHIWY